MKKVFFLTLVLIFLIASIVLAAIFFIPQENLSSPEKQVTEKTLPQGLGDKKVDMEIPTEAMRDTDSVWDTVLSIDENRSGYTRITIDGIGESTEGSTGDFYSENGDIKRITATYFGETGKTISDFYYDEGNLIYLVENIQRYNRPIYYDEAMAEEFGDSEAFDPEKTEIFINRYYLSKNSIIETEIDTDFQDDTFTKTFQDILLQSNSLVQIFYEHQSGDASFGDTIFSCDTQEGSVLLEWIGEDEFFFRFIGALDEPRYLTTDSFSYYQYLRGGSTFNEGLDLTNLLFNVDNLGFVLYSHVTDNSEEAGIKIYSMREQMLENKYECDPDSVLTNMFLIGDQIENSAIAGVPSEGDDFPAAWQ
jgi:hypothetical protein